MKRELPYFSIEGAFGGSQEWFTHDWWMRKGAVLPLQQQTAAFIFPFIKTFLMQRPRPRKK